MRRSGIGQAALAAVMALACGEARGAEGDAAPIVKLSGGAVSGTRTPTGAVFKGIAYAAPPVGPLRWQSPRAPHAWKGVRPAAVFGAPCAQAPLRGMTVISDASREDCLYLNVWTPQVASVAKRPVVVWIHGGGFINGMGSSPTYDGERFAAQGVILVTLNYRLGAFGFLAHPALAAESPHVSSGNYGLEDQIAALRWVSANIAAFGGDPRNVTIAGQSAGGASVLDVMASPVADGLFRRAIVESGAARQAIAPTQRGDAERQGLAFARGEPIARLRDLDTAAVLAMGTTFAQAGGRLGPVIDGYVLPSTAGTARRPVDLLIGSNAREGLATPEPGKLAAAITQAFGANAAAAMRAYGVGGDGQGSTDPVLGTPAQQFATDSTFRCGSVDVAGKRVAADGRTWQYQFEQSVPGREHLGAAHSVEVPYVFGTLSPTGFSGANYGDADRRLSALMNRYWANFAKMGDPNGAGLPQWPAYTTATRAFVRFSSTLAGGVEPAADLRGDICRLFPTAPSPRKD